MPSRSDGYLLDMLLAARSIQDFTSGQTQESFAADRLRIRAIEREFEILGEAARNVDEIPDSNFPALISGRLSECGILSHTITAA
jgi:uncharacterized protein with HEPN domain